MLEVALTGEISPFARVQTWFTSARLWAWGCPNESVSTRAAPKATWKIAKVVVKERIELVLMNIVKERRGVEGGS